MTPKIGAPDRKRAGVYAHKRINGVIVCLECSTPVERSPWSQPGRRRQLRCMPCIRTRDAASREVKRVAYLQVARAIRRGELRRPDQFACVDCNKPAQQYDHRDYSRPLDVEPVCRSCNILRGPGLIPAAAPADSREAA